MTATYLTILVEKVGQDMDQGRGQELGLTDVPHLQDILVLAQVEV